MKCEALKTVFYTSKDFIPPGAVFNSEAVNITAEAAAGLIAGGYLRSAAEAAAITFPIGPAAAPAAAAAPQRPKTAQEMIAFIATVTTLAQLEELLSGENRSTVLAAIQKRGDQLKAEADLAAILQQIEAAGSADELNQLAAGETREAVLKAIEAKHSALAG